MVRQEDLHHHVVATIAKKAGKGEDRDHGCAWGERGWMERRKPDLERSSPASHVF